jgi:hypothetical protein
VKNARSPREYPNYDAIEARILVLNPLDAEQYRVAGVIDELALIGLAIAERSGTCAATRHFQPATQEIIRKELTELARRARGIAKKIQTGGGATRARQQLAHLIDGLREPTIIALGACRPMPGPIPKRQATQANDPFDDSQNNAGQAQAAHDCETFAGVAGARRFDGGVQRKEIGLLGIVRIISTIAPTRSEMVGVTCDFSRLARSLAGPVNLLSDRSALPPQPKPHGC